MNDQQLEVVNKEFDLFIGGSADGEWIDTKGIDSNTYRLAPHPEPLVAFVTGHTVRESCTIPIEIYSRRKFGERIGDGGALMTVWVHEDIDDQSVFMHLLGGYKRSNYKAQK